MRLTQAFASEVAAFEQAAALSQPPIELIEIPFEKGSLPGYFLRSVAERTPRPTMVHVDGYDSNIQEMYFAHGTSRSQARLQLFALRRARSGP